MHTGLTYRGGQFGLGPRVSRRLLRRPKRSTGPSEIHVSPDAYAAVAALPDGSKVSFTAHTLKAPSIPWNAVARLSGSDSGEKSDIILLTAHLDHLGTRDTGADRIYNGADDDASGRSQS